MKNTLVKKQYTKETLQNEQVENSEVANKPPVFDVTKLDKKSLEILEETEDDEYRFTLSQFEGPLDLLLHLIKSTKIDIFDVPLSEITEQYLAYMKDIKELFALYAKTGEVKIAKDNLHFPRKD